MEKYEKEVQEANMLHAPPPLSKKKEQEQKILFSFNDWVVCVLRRIGNCNGGNYYWNVISFEVFQKVFKSVLFFEMKTFVCRGVLSLKRGIVYV